MTDNKTKKEDRHYKKVICYLPTSIDGILHAVAKDRKIPKSRLIAFIVDNALNDEKLLEYDVTLPAAEHEDHYYADQAGKVLKFISSFAGGVTIESVVLCRRDLGIDTKYEVFQGIKELIKHNIIKYALVSRNSARRYNYSETTRKLIVVEPLNKPLTKKGRDAKREKAERAIRTAQRALLELDEEERQI